MEKAYRPVESEGEVKVRPKSAGFQADLKYIMLTSLGSETLQQLKIIYISVIETLMHKCSCLSEMAYVQVVVKMY